MTFNQFREELSQKLRFLPSKKREQILAKYQRLFYDAKNLGIDEASFVASLGSIDAIAEKARSEAPVTTTSSNLNSQLRLGAAYLVSGLISIAAIFLVIGIFSFGLLFFMFGITKLIQNTNATSGASALYIGQMLVGAGIWIVTIGFLTKTGSYFQLLIKKLQQAFNPTIKEQSHE